VRTLRHRGRPWDAGPEVTARDLVALGWITEQYTARLDVAAVLLGRLSPIGSRTPGRLGPRTLRQRLERWEQAGWTIRRRLLGHTWIVPTTAGIRLTGLALDPWEPVAARLSHHHAVALVRLARESAPGQAGWVCERELWRRRGKASWHLADGALPVEVPAMWRQRGIGEAFELVEVELHQKAAGAPSPRSRPSHPRPPRSPTTRPQRCMRPCRPRWPRSPANSAARFRSGWSCCPR
jgi:hypothetical protein